VNAKYFKLSSVFNWTEIKNSAYYILEIFDQSLYSAWDSIEDFNKNSISILNKP